MSMQFVTFLSPLSGRLAVRTMLSLVAALLAAQAQADEVPWHFTAGPWLNAAGFTGNGAVGPASGRLSVPFHRAVKDVRFAVAGGLLAEHGPLGLWLSGQYLDLAQDLHAGDVPGRAAGQATQLSAGVWYRTWQQYRGGMTVHGGLQQISLAPLAGVRMTRLQATVAGDGLSASRRVNWAIPFAGARLTADLGPRWQLTAESDLGAWGRDFTAQGQVAAGYRLDLPGRPVLYAGYQVLHEDHKEAGFHWNMTQYGPLAGLTVTF